LDYLSITTSEALPDWTRTSLEWNSLPINYWVRAVVIILNVFVLMKLQGMVKGITGLHK